MKKICLLTMFALVTMTGWAQEHRLRLTEGKNKYTVKADIAPMVKEMAKHNVVIDSFYLADYASKKPITEKFALQGNKVEVSGKVETPQIAALMLEMRIPGGVRTNHIPFILEGGNITITTDGYSCGATGTLLNDSLFSATRQFGGAMQKGESDKAQGLIKDYILRHRGDLTAVLMLTALNNQSEEDGKKVLALIGQCDKAVQQHPLIVRLSEKINTLINRPKEGDMFKDFAVEYDGKTTHLSDYVGKGKYVLVDFWASWCGPCRAEIPNIIAAHEKYKDKAFTALGVAVSDKPEDTLKAIEKDKIPYPQILNSKGIAPSIYGFSGIPYIVLFAPDGTILACDLRGGDINKKLAEIFGE
jgi:thiol-disulfide isomerase/thioredoxin